MSRTSRFLQRRPAGRNAPRADVAPWDEPSTLRRLSPRPRTRHATRDRAPEPLDLRLAPAAAAAWASAFWAVGLGGPRPWSPALLGALVAVAAAMPLGAAAARFRPPRHRHDPRPGAGYLEDSAVGSLAASLLALALTITAVLTVTAADSWSRARDPLTIAAQEERTVTLTGTLTRTPRATATSRRTTVLSALSVDAVDGAPSHLTATVLGDADWLAVPLGAPVRVRARLRPAAPGKSEAAIIGANATVSVTGPATGLLSIVARLRDGLGDAVGPEPTAPAADPSRTGVDWPAGTRALVPGVALGDDHALPTPVREDMRAVSMTHLTAVSGQHVAIVLGLVLAALGAAPRWARAAVGALVLAGLVVLVRPDGSVLRAAAMGAVMLLGVGAGRRSASLPALSAGVIVLLLLDPWQARDYGFALSVLATAGILLGSAPLTAVLSRRLPRPLAAGVALPLVAQLACAPVLVLLRPTVGIWSVPANVLAAPPVPVATVCGILAALVSPLSPRAAVLIAWPATASCAWLVLVARAFARLPGASVNWPGHITGALLLAGIEAAVIAAAYWRGRRRTLRRRRRGRL
ncbi:MULTISPECIES: ComEC/Rec2 family competence protein [unclassified Actinomyces]|uniref:ComEC/Rec2 family competence protein n=1 Tax=unclassified Actinomyces TaxID=2609248 RepID=UPI0013739607|nr:MULTISPECIES: ComEC/Rec2 family competence protein [unclassified Actinomyces]QHO91176.1 competence protein ComEC [Actinomyces sp. 432]